MAKNINSLSSVNLPRDLHRENHNWASIYHLYVKYICSSFICTTFIPNTCIAYFDIFYAVDMPLVHKCILSSFIINNRISAELTEQQLPIHCSEERCHP